MNTSTWFEAHADLPDHVKTILTAAALKIDKDALVGKLHRLWNWMISSHQMGVIASIEMETVAEIMRWHKSTKELFDALCIVPYGHEHGFLYPINGGFMVNDWNEYTKRYYKTIDKKKKDQQRYAEKTLEYM